jgi:hypothetical protein
MQCYVFDIKLRGKREKKEDNALELFKGIL